MKVTGSFKTQVPCYQSPRKHITEDPNFNNSQAQTVPSQRWENNITTNHNLHPSTENKNRQKTV